MTLLDEILQHNQKFVSVKGYKPYLTDKFPDKKLVVVTCMDTRLIELLPHAMDIGQGEAKVIKVAGAVVSHPFGSVMRSILVAIYELGAQEVVVVGHHQCGMTGLKKGDVLEKAVERGVKKETIALLEAAGVDLGGFLMGFPSVEEAVKKSVSLIRKHPLMPAGVAVHGMVIDPETGGLEVVDRGY